MDDEVFFYPGGDTRYTEPRDLTDEELAEIAAYLNTKGKDDADK